MAQSFSELAIDAVVGAVAPKSDPIAVVPKLEDKVAPEDPTMFFAVGDVPENAGATGIVRDAIPKAFLDRRVW